MQQLSIRAPECLQFDGRQFDKKFRIYGRPTFRRFFNRLPGALSFNSTMHTSLASEKPGT